MRTAIYDQKCITFSVPIKKEVDNGKIIGHKIKFIDSFRFMSTSFSKLVDNLSEIYSKKMYREENCEFECDFKGLKNNKLSYRCSECKKNQLKPINGLIKKSFQINTNFVIEASTNLFSY